MGPPPGETPCPVDDVITAITELVEADSGQRLLEDAARWAARLSGSPCIVVVDGLAGRPHVLGPVAAGDGSTGLARWVGPSGRSRRWLPAEWLGMAPDDPPVRPCVRLPLGPERDGANIGDLVLFEVAGAAGGRSAAPTAAGTEAAAAIARVAGALLAGGPGGRCACSAEVERARILIELHDGLLQHLYGLGLAIESQARNPGHAELRPTLRRWSRTLSDTIEQTRGYLELLDQPDSTAPDLGAGLDELAREAATAGFDVVTEVTVDASSRLPASLRAGLFQVLREAVRNAMRHSQATRLTIHADVDADRLSVEIEDNGVGFAPGAVSKGHGLEIMTTRAASLGCRLKVASTPGFGTRVSIVGSLAGQGPDAACPDCGCGET